MNVPFAAVIAIVLLLSVGVCLDVAKAQASTVIIKADGKLEPSSSLIQREGDIYRVTENLNFSINVQRGGIILDGGNYTLQGLGFSSDSIGISLMASNVTVRNFHVSGWRAGIYGAYNGNNITNNVFVDNYQGIALYASDYVVSNNKISGSDVAIFIDSGFLHAQGDNNLIIQNQIFDNNWAIDIVDSNGTIFLKNNVTNNNVILTLGTLGTSRDQAGHHLFYLNNFVDNKRVLHIPFGGPFVSRATPISPAGNWDNGTFGNYWSDYSLRYPNASRLDHAGVNDEPYLIEHTVPWSSTDANGTHSSGTAILGTSKDNYPLINSYKDNSEANPQYPTSSPSILPTSTLNPQSTADSQVWLLLTIIVIIAVLIAVVNRKKLIEKN